VLFLKKLRKMLSSLVTIILSITLLFMVFVVISSKVKGGEPSILGYQLKTVLSGSMEPTFKTGSIIAIKPLQSTIDLKKGEVITFKSNDDPSMLITHRIHDVMGSGKNITYVTKGDNNEDPDNAPVLPQNIVGEYQGFTIPYIGYLLNFGSSKIGSALLLILPGILILGYSIFTIWGLLTAVEEEKKNKTVEN
jgi:signal peptidase I